MIYRAIRKIVKLALFVFFKRLVVTGAERIPENGPLLLVANHPNTLMDPLIVAAIAKRRIGFIANGGLFSNRFLKMVLNYFHVIPIYRQKDVQPGIKPDNNATFIKCHQYLRDGGSLLIFPEGSSYYELKLREIKTGTARIALSFEALQDFESNLQIIPIALDYSDSLQFRSMVSVTVNPSIPTKNFRNVYLENEYEAVTELTEVIRKSLAENIPQTTGKEQEDFLIKAHKFYATFYEPEADLYYDPKRSLQLRSQLSGALHFVEKQHKSLYENIQENVNLFFMKMKSAGLTAGFFTEQFIKKDAIMVCSGYLLIFVLLAPFYLFGLLTNYIPYILPSRFFLASKADIEYKTSIQIVTGLITFPLFYTVEILLFRKFITPDLIYTVALLFILPLTGYLAMYYHTEAKRCVRVFNYYFIMKPKQKHEMLQLRDEILQQMEETRQLLR